MLSPSSQAAPRDDVEQVRRTPDPRAPRVAHPSDLRAAMAAMQAQPAAMQVQIPSAQAQEQRPPEAGAQQDSPPSWEVSR